MRARDGATLMFGIALVGSQAMMMAPLLPEVSAGLKTTITSVGTALGAYGASTALAALAAGLWLDRVQRRIALAGSAAVLALAMALCSAAPSVWVLGLGQALAGIGAGSLLPAGYAFVAEASDSDVRSRNLSRVLQGWSLSLIVGIPVGAVLGDLLGWRGVYALLAAAFLCAVIAYRRLPEVGRAQDSAKGALRAVLADRAVLGLFVCCLGYMTAFYGMYTYLGDQARLQFGYGPQFPGLLALSYGVGFMLGGGTARLVERLGAIRALLIASAVIAATYGILPSAFVSAAALLLWMGFLGVVNHLGLNGLISALTDASGPRRGTVLALNTGVTYIGYLAGAAGMGQLYGAFGYEAVAYGAAVCMAVGFVAVSALVLPLRGPAPVPR